MRSKVLLLEKDGSVSRLLSKSDILSFSKKIGGGAAQIKIPKYSRDATEENLQKWNKIGIDLWDDDEQKFKRAYSGIIESVLDEESSYRVGLQPPEELLRKRFTNQNQNITGQAGQSAQALLSQTNSDNDTGIDVGLEDVTEIVDLTQNENTIFLSIDDLAKKTDSEWEITSELKLNFLQRLGKDKTNDIIFRYNVKDPSNYIIKELKTDADAKGMANRIIATSTDGVGSEIRSVVEDSVSINKYGLLVEKIRIDSAKDQTTLDSMAQTVLDQKKEEFLSLEIIPGRKILFEAKNQGTQKLGIGFFDLSVGDDVFVIVNDGINSYEGTRRVLEIKFNVTQNMEDITFTLSKIGVKKTFLDAISSKKEMEEMNDRIRILETLL